MGGEKERQRDSSKFAVELEFNLLGDAVEVAEAAHERVPKAVEVALSFISLVKMLLGLHLPAMWRTLMVPF